MRLRVKDLRQYLTLRNIPTDTCREKEDLVELVLCTLGPRPRIGEVEEEEEEQEQEEEVRGSEEEKKEMEERKEGEGQEQREVKEEHEGERVVACSEQVTAAGGTRCRNRC